MKIKILKLDGIIWIGFYKNRYEGKEGLIRMCVYIIVYRV